MVREKPQFFQKKSRLPRGTRIIETVDKALRELFITRNPQYKSAAKEDTETSLQVFLRAEKIPTLYVYFPWKKTAIHMVPEDVYFELRTARNKNIITTKEQERYRNGSVGIVGLSVGANVLNALVFSGGPKTLKLADYDVLEITNLNRLRAPLDAIGKNKALFAARETWELDPFSTIEIWQNGVTVETLKTFCTKPKLDIFIDEMDSLDLKLMARVLCKKAGIPVVMVTDNGENIIVDVERFDKEPTRDILHGLVQDIDPTKLSNLPYAEWVKIATRMVDPKNLVPRMRESLREIGKTLAAVPQLGTTATIAGAAAAYVVRKILNNQPMPSGRYVLELDSLLANKKQ